MLQCSLSMRRINVFTRQYIGAEGCSKITYRGTMDEKQTAMKRKHTKSVCDKMHFLVPLINVRSAPTSKRNKIYKNGCDRREVEVFYADVVQFRDGCLATTLRRGNGLPTYDDDETMEVTLPD